MDYKHMTDRELKGHRKAAVYREEEKTVQAIDAEIDSRIERRNQPEYWGR